MDGETIHNNKLPNKTYISKPFPQLSVVPDYKGGSMQEYNNIRIVSKVIDSEEQFSHAKLKDELILRKTGKGRQEIIAKVYEDTRGVTVLSLQRYTQPSGKPHESSFSFVGEEIQILYDFINNIQYFPLDSPTNTSINDNALKDILTSKENTRQFVIDNQELLSEMVSLELLTKEDIVALGYRKKQLEVFSKLLTDQKYFDHLKRAYNASGNEHLWQLFFEKNTWIFGYGLSYVFNTPLEDSKLEQYVSGFDFNNSGKRIDALLKTKGIIESFCFAEIKTHNAHLLKQVNTPYRAESWQISNELSGAIAQVQRTVQKSVANIRTRTDIKDRQGNLTGEKVYLYNPKAFIVIGSLEEFNLENGINEDKYSSFEMFRQGINKIEIITFDELFQRASFIVRSNENAGNQP